MPIPFDATRWRRFFVTIWSGQALSVVGSRMVGFALIWWLTVRAGSASMLALASLMDVLPRVALQPFVGPLVDRWERRRVMIASDGATAAATALLSLLFLLGLEQPFFVLFFIALRTCGTVFHEASMMAATTLMVPKGELTRVGGMNETVMGVSNMGAPLLGAVLVSLVPVQAILALDVVTAAAAITPLALIAIPELDAARVDARAASPLRSLMDGFRHLLGSRGLLLLFAYSAGVRLFAKPAWQFLPLLVTRHFRGDAVQLGALSSAWGAGLIGGGVLLSVWGGFKRRVLTVWVGLLGCSLSFLALGVIPSDGYRIALAACVFFGVSFSVYMGPARAIIQATAPPEIQGRIFALYAWSFNVATPVGLAFFGLFGDAVGVTGMFALGGAFLLLFTVLMGATPSVMKLEAVAQT